MVDSMKILFTLVLLAFICQQSTFARQTDQVSKRNVQKEGEVDNVVKHILTRNSKDVLNPQSDEENFDELELKLTEEEEEEEEAEQYDDLPQLIELSLETLSNSSLDSSNLVKKLRNAITKVFNSSGNFEGFDDEVEEEELNLLEKTKKSLSSFIKSLEKIRTDKDHKYLMEAERDIINITLNSYYEIFNDTANNIKRLSKEWTKDKDSEDNHSALIEILQNASMDIEALDAARKKVLIPFNGTDVEVIKTTVKQKAIEMNSTRARLRRRRRRQSQQIIRRFRSRMRQQKRKLRKRRQQQRRRKQMKKRRKKFRSNVSKIKKRGRKRRLQTRRRNRKNRLRRRRLRRKQMLRRRKLKKLQSRRKKKMTRLQRKRYRLAVKKLKAQVRRNSTIKRRRRTSRRRRQSARRRRQAARRRRRASRRRRQATRRRRIQAQKRRRMQAQKRRRIQAQKRRRMQAQKRPSRRPKKPQPRPNKQRSPKTTGNQYAVKVYNRINDLGEDFEIINYRPLPAGESYASDVANRAEEEKNPEISSYSRKAMRRRRIRRQRMRLQRRLRAIMRKRSRKIRRQQLRKRRRSLRRKRKQQRRKLKKIKRKTRLSRLRQRRRMQKMIQRRRFQKLRSQQRRRAKLILRVHRRYRLRERARRRRISRLKSLRRKLRARRNRRKKRKGTSFNQPQVETKVENQIEKQPILDEKTETEKKPETKEAKQFGNSGAIDEDNEDY